MQITCRNQWCQQLFEVTNADLAFYEKVSPIFAGRKELIPPPTLCPECRLQRRLASRNEHHLHKSACGLCGKSIISSFPAQSPFPVYCKECWWSDCWDPLQYGRDFDFSRPFFSQFQELLNAVPKAAVLQLNNENCDFNHLLAFSKNSYLCPGSYFVEDCLYLRKSQYCRDCANGNILNRCELVADSVNCDGCVSAHHLSNCRNCSSSSYLSDCSGLKDCFMCSGLTSKQFCFKNKQLTSDAYAQTLRHYSQKSPEALFHAFQEFNRTIPKRAQIQLHCEDSSGDYLANCKNTQHCSDCINCEDSSYLLECEGDKDSMDCSMHDKDNALCYEMCSGGEKNYLTLFCYCTIASPRSATMSSCFYQSDSFGCVELHTRGQYRILNRQYTKQEYEQIVPKIIAKMRTDGEWGEYLPVRISLYAYNQSTAFDYFPLTKEETLKRGWPWRDQHDELPKVAKVIPAEKLPDSIDDVPDDIVNWAIECKATKRPFKIIKQELEFYRKMQLPIPHLHPDERQRRRMMQKNPRKLWNRECAKCQKSITTSYAPERPEKVVCEECYLKEVY